MITKTIAQNYSTFYHVTLRNRDGSAVRCRANGACKTWKTRPDDFRLPVKYGFKECFYITPQNAGDWLTYDPTEPEFVPQNERDAIYHAARKGDVVAKIALLDYDREHAGSR